jgi:hypothetical protein
LRSWTADVSMGAITLASRAPEYSFISFLSFLRSDTTWMPFPRLYDVGLRIQTFLPVKWLIGMTSPLDLDVKRFTLPFMDLRTSPF